MSSKQNSSADSKNHSESETSQSENDTSLDILTRIRQKLIDMGDPPFSLQPKFTNNFNTTNATSKNSNSQNNIICIYCLNNIQKNDILCTMPCCNGICHVKCVKEIDGKEEMLQACPKCLSKIPSKFKETIDSICSII